LRTQLTQEYIKKRYKVSLQGIELTPRMIVVHLTGTDNLSQAFGLMMEPSVSIRQSEAGGRYEKEVNISAHFLVDRNGMIYSLMKDFEIARHVAGLDRHAIGIKNVGRAESSLTDAQLESNAKLIRFLRNKYGTINYLVGNSETPAFQATPLWELKEPYEKPVRDPGDAFMSNLRARVADLDLKSAP
jgi:N-acetylmuramoyl-L-alanine amidase